MKIIEKIKRKIKKNPLDVLLKKARKENKKKFLLAWNRALGDISLGLYAVSYRIKQYIKDAQITFIVREDLKDGFALLHGVKIITVPFWRRYMPFDIYHTLKLLNVDHTDYDVILDKADPAYWVKWQLSSLPIKLKWDQKFDCFHEKFGLPDDKIIIGVLSAIETKHSPWRSWPFQNFQELFIKASKDIVFVLFGTQKDENFKFFENVMDLRGKTTLIEALSILKNRCLYFISLDSGLLSLFYYLDVDFPVKLITLWGSRDAGILKQNVLSPNKKMVHLPLVRGENLPSLKPDELLENVYPNDIEGILKQNSQQILLNDFKKMPLEDKKNLIKEIFSVDPKVLEKQKSFFSKTIKKNNFRPLEKSSRGSLSDYNKGQKLVSSRKAAAIIMAAGQGSRLGFFGPKGLFKIKDKTLFEYHIEKILNKQKKYGVKLYFSVMTSHLNHNQTVKYFDENSYFGLEKEQVDFFTQKKAPFMDERGGWLLQNKKIVQAPDGNGSIFQSFNESLILAKYLRRDIKYISVIPVDNPLVDPFDEKFLGFHKNNNNEVTIKCIKREKADEQKGAIAVKGDKIKIIEYIDLDRDKKYYFSNSGIYVLNTEFFKKMNKIDLRYCFVLKKISNESEIFAYKSENFIFDAFDYAGKIKTLVDVKENFYAPVKDISNIKEIEKLLAVEKLSRIC